MVWVEADDSLPLYAFAVFGPALATSLPIINFAWASRVSEDGVES